MRHTYRGVGRQLALIGFVKLFGCGWALCLRVSVPFFHIMPWTIFFLLRVCFYDSFWVVVPEDIQTNRWPQFGRD